MDEKRVDYLLAEELPRVEALRHQLHRRPELAYEETETARSVAEYLEGLDGVEVTTGLAGTGLSVTIGSHLPGPCVALRADMDALPMEEASGVAWSSERRGVMHACGHDGHTAMLAGAARVLAQLQDQLNGPVKCIFQPAEEGGAGALKLCEAGVLANPEVAAVFGLHANLPEPDLAEGLICWTSGAMMAGSGTFDIEIIGQGGHAAFPHRCIDPIYIGSALVQQLQSLVSRRNDPVNPAVVSVTRFHAGTAHNIIPATCQLSGTFRALDPRIMSELCERIREMAEVVAKAHGAEVRAEVDASYPVLINNPRAEGIFREIVEAAGESHRIRMTPPIMGGEDFAYYCQRVPAFFYFLPACPPGCTDNPVCHSPRYDFNDRLLPLGMRLHVHTGLRFARLWGG